jgi:hypothetical protein
VGTGSKFSCVVISRDYEDINNFENYKGNLDLSQSAVEYENSV